jgi:hypothetical protein
MTSRDFCYWLQGFLELNTPDDIKPVSKEQVQCIQKHLALVFTHEIDPSHGDEEAQKKLNAIHNLNAIAEAVKRC